MSDLEKLEKDRRIRRKVAEEILSTELDYVADLETIVDVFVTPLRAGVPGAADTNLSGSMGSKAFGSVSSNNSSSAGSPAGSLASGVLAYDPNSPYVISKRKIDQMFSNVGTLKGVNEKFCDEMRTRIDTYHPETTTIGDVFTQFGPFFKMYKVYINNHEQAQKTVMDQLARNRKFKDFCGEQTTNPRCRMLNLQSLLIKPVQRIPRYILLLTDLRKRTPDTHPDAPTIDAALEVVGDVASSINEGVRDRESRDKILEIQSHFSGKVELVAPSRVLVRQGPLTKQCKKADKRYEFFLFNDLLVYSVKLGNQKYKLHRQMPIDGKGSLRVQDIDDTRFQMVSPKKSFVVYADSPAEKRQWLADLQTAIAGATQSILGFDQARLRAPSGSLAPVWQQDKNAKQCTLCSDKFSFTNRRHHCRRCGIVVCGACGKARAIIKTIHRTQGQRVCDRCVTEIRAAPAPLPMSVQPKPQPRLSPQPSQQLRKSPIKPPPPPPRNHQAHSRGRLIRAAPAGGTATGPAQRRTVDGGGVAYGGITLVDADQEAESSDGDSSDDDTDEAPTPPPPASRKQPPPARRSPPASRQLRKQPPSQALANQNFSNLTITAPPTAAVIAALRAQGAQQNRHKRNSFLAPNGKLVCATGLPVKPGFVAPPPPSKSGEFQPRQPKQAATPTPTPTAPTTSSNTPAAASNSVVAPTPTTTTTTTATQQEAPKTNTSTVRCRALHGFAGQAAGDLAFSEGDVITVHSEDASGWWQGELNGVTGAFPCTYVEKIQTKAPPPPVPPRPASKLLYIGTADHAAQGQGELAFAKGQTIEVLQFDDSGWWLGQLHANGAGSGEPGWFSKEFVKQKPPAPRRPPPTAQ